MHLRVNPRYESGTEHGQSSHEDPGGRGALNAHSTW
jgi:hypothetical protein